MNRKIAEGLFQEATTLFGSGDFDEALARLGVLLEAFPGDRRVLLAQVQCHAARGTIEAALGICEYLIEEHQDTRARELQSALKLGKYPRPAPTEMNALDAGRTADAVSELPFSALAPSNAHEGPDRPPPQDPIRLLRRGIRMVMGAALTIAVVVVGTYARQVKRQLDETRVTAEDSNFAYQSLRAQRARQIVEREPDAPAAPTPRVAAMEVREAGHEWAQEQWGVTPDQPVPVWRPGIFRRVPCVGAPERTLDVYVPMAYEARERDLFPWLMISWPSPDSGFIGMQGWAETNDVVVFVVNSSCNGTYERNEYARKVAYDTLFPTMRLNPTLGFAMGMSGGARTSWEAVCKDPEAFRGVVMIAFGGYRLCPPPWHLRIGYIHGNQDFNNDDIALAVQQAQQAGHPCREIVFEGGHDTGPMGARVAMLDWMLQDALTAVKVK